MKKLILSLIFLAAGIAASAQAADKLVSQCLLSAGDGAKYLKDFRIQLGQTDNLTELRYKVRMSLWKNTRYRFSLCNAAESKGNLILIITDEKSKLILSSRDPKTGKSFSSIDFTCNKSGIYQLGFDFEKGQQGMGVGVVSMIR